MTREDIFEYYGSWYKFQRDTGASASNQLTWKRYGYVPIAMQLRLQNLTGGKLIADKEDPKCRLLIEKI